MLYVSIILANKRKNKKKRQEEKTIAVENDRKPSYHVQAHRGTDNIEKRGFIDTDEGD